jgi:proline iminopeptidase
MDGYIPRADGVRLFFQRVGSGPQTVLIPNGFHMFDDFQRLAAGRTLIFYDVRNRGKSDTVVDASKLAGGIHNDVDDLDAVRRHFDIGQTCVMGHSYTGLMVGLYAMKYPSHVDGVIQIGAMQPYAGKEYPAHLTNTDPVLAEVMAKLGHMQRPPDADPVETCKQFWSVLRAIYVANPADAHKIDWGRCDLPNERNLMPYWIGQILPSIQKLEILPEDAAKVTARVLIVHGTKDRSAPYGGALDWASLFPNARLETVENAAHAPWIEAPEQVFGAIEAFLDSQ